MSTIKLSHNNYFDIEQIIKKIAEENDIKDVKSIKIKLSKDSGIVKFAVIDDWIDFDEEGEEIRYTQNVEKENEEESAASYGPYKFRITYQIVTPESAEVGDYEDQGWELQDGQADDMDDLIYELDNYGFYEDVGHGLDELRFETVDPVQDRAYFEDGESKYYTVFINREDGEQFGSKEVNEIKQRLGIR